GACGGGGRPRGGGAGLRAIDPAAGATDQANALTAAYTGQPASAFLLAWALADTGVPPDQVATRTRQAIPTASAADIASALAAAQDPAVTAARDAVRGEPCSLPEAARRRRTSFAGLHPRRSAYALARADGLRLARPAGLRAARRAGPARHAGR
ncbi:hypothetical protein I6A84_22075, partial [Frankia sp. CNm7]